MTTELILHWYAFDQLSGAQVYEMLALRQEVFVVEQSCLYHDIDGLDPHCLHLFGRDAGGRLAAYLRLVPPGVVCELPAIGRVVTRRRDRGRGIGRALVQEALRKADELYAASGVCLFAQVHLQRFYESLGFQAAGEPFDDEGIPHVKMVQVWERPAKNTTGRDE